MSHGGRHLPSGEPDEQVWKMFQKGGNEDILLSKTRSGQASYRCGV